LKNEEVDFFGTQCSNQENITRNPLMIPDVPVRLTWTNACGPG